ncbi:MAG: response regulator [Terriglobales bacterium]
MARKILLADDSVTAQNMGRKILADAGYDVVTVNNGSAALKKIAELKPDLIVLDVYMPGYSGLEVCQRLKEDEGTEHIPVLLTVGKLEPFKAEEARRVRADAHIVKPFEASELLTAITRLEDRMVPRQAQSQSEDGWRSEGAPGSDAGWKSRLGFPKKKKEEPEEAAGGGFRDFRKGKSKAGKAEGFAVKTAPPVQEPSPVPDIPRDITPEELDALSAVAAKLEGPAAETTADTVAEKTTSGLIEAAEATPAKEVEVPVAAADGAPEAVAAPELAVEAPAVETLAVETKNEIEIPVVQVEPVAEVTGGVAAAAAGGIQQTEGQQTEAQPTEMPETVNAALLTQEAAPVDGNDEPAFAAATLEPAAEAVAEVKTVEEKVGEEKIEVKAVEEAAQVEAAEAKGPESKPEEPVAEELKVEGTERPAPVEEPSPSDEELAQALRLLTPATGHTEDATVSWDGTLAVGSRWVAEPVALNPEEAEISLEAEMFHVFATSHGDEIAASGTTGVSAIAAAVENRLAAAGLGASAESVAAPEMERLSAEPVSVEAVSSEQVSSEQASSEHAPSEDGVAARGLETVTEAPVQAAETVSDVAASCADSTEVVTEAEKIEPAAAEPATFADAVARNEDEVAAKENGESADANTAASAVAVAESEDQSSSGSNSPVEDEESMRKDGKSKSGKSNGHEVRDAAVGAAASNNTEEAEAAPRSMAAAAAEGSAPTSSPSSTSASSPVPDAGTIASIVDSVMADLRPKIVEEIAKRLAGK